MILTKISDKERTFISLERNGISDEACVVLQDLFYGIKKHLGIEFENDRLTVTDDKIVLPPFEKPGKDYEIPHHVEEVMQSAVATAQLIADSFYDKKKLIKASKDINWTDYENQIRQKDWMLAKEERAMKRKAKATESNSAK